MSSEDSTSPQAEPAEGLRLPRAEVERRIMAVATKRVMDHGLSINFDQLRMDSLIAEAEVPKSSVYRRWPKKEDFFADFLPMLAGPLSQFNSAYDEETQRVATTVLQENVHMLSTREGRIAVVREAVRRAVDQNYGAMAGDGRWRAYSALVATVSSASEEMTQASVAAALHEADQTFLTAMAGFYEGLLPWVRGRLREGVTAMDLAAAGAAVVEGLVTRRSINPDVADAQIPGPAIDGGTCTWSLAATGFLGVVMQMVEFDADARDLLAPQSTEG